MKEFGHICIEEISEHEVGGGEYFGDIQQEHAEKLMIKIKQLAKDFILANNCSVDLVDHQDESGFGFYVINKQELGLINVYYEEQEPELLNVYNDFLYQTEDFSSTFEKILANFFQINNPTGFLKKVSDEEALDFFFKMTVEGKLS